MQAITDYRHTQNARTGGYELVLHTVVRKSDFNMTAHTEGNGVVVWVTRFTDYAFEYNNESLWRESSVLGEGVQYIRTFVETPFHMEAIQTVYGRLRTHADEPDELTAVGRGEDEE